MVTHALIPAAGRGIRAYPKTASIPKVLLEIDGRSIIQRNIEILRDCLGIHEITIIVGYLREQIIDRLGDGRQLGVSLRYVKCTDPDHGLARGMLLVRDQFKDRFITILGDELYLDSNHKELKDVFDCEFDAACGVLRTDDLHQIKRNYSVRIENGRISTLVEKPTVIENNLLGCGTYVFTPRIFDAIEATRPSPQSGRIELTDAIDKLAGGSPGVIPFHLKGTYFNVNTIDDYNYAQYVVRAGRFGDYKISVIIPAYNEEGSIAYVVRDFSKWVDEVFVVDNSSADRTAAVAREAGARVETVKLIGYGDTIRYGLDHATGDILVVVEADFSFRARDLNKMLEYLKDADMVVGTRTTRELVEQGTNMRGPVRWGNVVVAKMMELLWWGKQPRFTDVGCTYRALWRDTYVTIRPLLHGVGPELSPEMMIAILQAGKRIIEVPVSYHRRIGGESKHSANYFNISRTALRMLGTIARKRFGRANAARSAGHRFGRLSLRRSRYSDVSE
jgi:UDP-N-acetylglucosamine diphosphorylase / glucose-1-phosphate thymidylyltransferase / UDP-N-acetylgalactosamine diphosphorylase / glucosamine-1-phosphate N-acetyltransferase / galactosamine-1-phosphate N-acetyltransferase